MYNSIYSVFPEAKTLCVRFLACLSSLRLLALNTFGKWRGKVICWTQTTRVGASQRLFSLLPCSVDAFLLCGVGNCLPGVGWFRTPGDHSCWCHLVGWWISWGMLQSFRGLRGVVWPGDSVGSNSSWICFSHLGNIRTRFFPLENSPTFHSMHSW